MKFALVDGQRREAQPGLSGECPGCGATMVAKCGEIRVWYWSHTGKRTCDPWWENETEWHKTWKNHFPDQWQEVFHRAEDGERHIADVRTEHGTVIEFQHSHLRPEERRAREGFYRPLIWVVDGLRRKRDAQKFEKILRGALVAKHRWLTFLVPQTEGALLRDWVDSCVPVFFDFGETMLLTDDFRFREPVLWYLDPNLVGDRAIVAPVWRSNVIRTLRSGRQWSGIPARQVVIPAPLPMHRLAQFDQYMARKRGRRARF